MDQRQRCQLQQLGKSCIGAGSLGDISHSMYSLHDTFHSRYSCAPSMCRLCFHLTYCHRDRLEELDISWCRKVPLEALGMLADNCVALRRLHIWGCSQITEEFLYGHSNDALQILGGKLDTTGPEAAKAVLIAAQ